MSELEKTIDYKFNNKKLLKDAITHTSFGITDFQTLEFLGDRVLGLIVATLLIEDPKYKDIKKLANQFSVLVSANFLIQIAQKWAVDKFLKHSIENVSQKVFVDCVEAIIGAIYLDCGYEKTSQLLSILWQDVVHKSFVEPKMWLQEFSQSKGIGVPSYEYREYVESGKIIYEAIVDVKNFGKAFASGSSKHEASKNAAQKLMKKLNEK